MTETSSRNPDRHTLYWFMLPLAVFPLLALLTYDWRAVAELSIPAHASSNWVGALGDSFAYYGYKLAGLAIWLVPAYSIAGCIACASGHRPHSGWRKLWLVPFLFAAAALVEPLGTAPGVAPILERVNLDCAGGVIGYLLMTRLLAPLVGAVGSNVILVGAAVASLTAAIGLKTITGATARLVRWMTAGVRSPEPPTGDDPAETARYEAEQAQYLAALRAKAQAKEDARIEKERIRAQKAAAKEAAKAEREAAREAARAERRPATVRPATVAVEEDDKPETDDRPYLLPPMSLLNPLKKSTADHSDVGEMSGLLIDTLKLFGVDATMSYTVEGPVVTKYALELAPGTRYSTVTGLQDNLMGALRAKSLRIEAPIPGESAVGIEVPNRAPAGISFREIFESAAWRDTKAELPLLFGKRADGKELVADLASMPHMLVAGATGQGKSVCLNSLICGLLMTRTPDQLKLIMVDPKCVEFTPYSSIPHLLVPVITDNRKVVFSLHWAVAEMEKRLKLFARARVRNIYDYNHRKTFTQTDMFGNDEQVNADMPRTVPYIVIIIDEAADLIGQCGKEVNPDIQRITQKARAAGIHLILATQRPDAKIITGAIKANIPGRVAFKTSSSVDSRTILDDTGAENLIGKGDMLFRGKDGLLIRAQGAWISDDEIANVTKFIEEHSSTQFDDTFATKLGRVKEAAIEDPFADNEDDPDNAPSNIQEAKAEAREQVKAAANASDFKKAVECVINTRRASTSHFQRQMGWGYNHAAKILDMLTERGIVSPPQGMGPRQIAMDQDQLVAILNEGDAGENATAATPDADDNDINDNPEEAQ